MKILLFFSVPATLILSAGIFLSCKNQPSPSLHNKTNLQAQQKGFAVLELFTSQGCSSCPPADAILAKYASGNNDNIIPLAFHVDYWNRLGWKDPFSDTAYSQRQNYYSNKIEGSSTYTPQLIINGIKEMVGSDANKIGSTINEVLNATSTATVAINTVNKEGGYVSLSYTTLKLPNDANLNVALVQQKALTKIKAGENNGIDLTNYNIVRNFITVKAQATGNVSIAVPDAITKEKLFAVIYLQDNNTASILAAARTAIME
jgi:hypothetical protein